MMITIPIFMPIIKTLNIDPIWFGVIMLLNMEMAMTSPPFGLSLFVMKGISPPGVTMRDIYMAALPFLLCDLVAMASGGLLYICGDSDRPPVRANSDLSYCQAGVQAVLAMMIAHYHQWQTGEGQYIDVSLQECVTSILWHTQQHWDLNREIVTRTGKYMKREPKNMRNNFQCKDGAISWQD